MTSLVHHVPRLRLIPTPATGRGLAAVKARGHLRVAVAIVAVVACLVAVTLLTVAAVAGIDTQGRIPHPAPLPAPTGHASAGS